MLYILNKTTTISLEQLVSIGAEDTEKTIIFVLDAVFLTTKQHIQRLKNIGIDDFYAEKEAIAARFVAKDDDVILIDYVEMAKLLEDADKIITL